MAEFPEELLERIAHDQSLTDALRNYCFHSEVGDLTPAGTLEIVRCVLRAAGHDKLLEALKASREGALHA